MRWVVHWIVGEAALKGRSSLAFQLGCVMPDWFETRPIHRWRESGEKFLDRAEHIRGMRKGWRKDYLLGTLAHYACDYCTMAHNEEYYRFYRHRTYEVMAQNMLIRRCRGNGEWFVSGSVSLPDALTVPENSEAFRQALSAWIATHMDALHENIEALHSLEWFREEKIADLDIREGYLLISELVRIL